jgi:hypothetical protein
MSKTPHTPGRWRIYKDKYALFEKNRFVISEDGVLIADTYADYPDTNLGLPEEEEFPANARLIAAAPDMLEAAEKVLARWERGDLAEAIRELAFAVSNARGETQTKRKPAR